MTSTHKKVSMKKSGNHEKYTPVTAAQGVDEALKILEGKWKLFILFHLFDKSVLRFSDLQRAIPAITQKMLTQQLRQLEADGLVHRKLYPEVPPRVEYRLTAWGQALCPTLDSLLTWAAQKPKIMTK
jgi:DNA-binding HxlR family transcriptional regulator